MVAFVAIALGTLTQVTNVADPVNRSLTDEAFRFRGTDRDRLGDIVFVAIDDASISGMQRRRNGEARFPFQRRVHAQLVRRLTKAQVKAIVYDVDFDGPTTDTDDAALLTALQRSPPSVLAATAVNEDGITATLRSEKNVEAAGSKVGLALLRPDGDGVLRNLTTTALGRATLPVVVARTLHAAPPRSDALIDYAGPAGTIRTVSFFDVLRGSVPAGALRGKVVVIGAQTPALNDLESTPFGQPPMPGTEVLANAIATIRRGSPLRRAQWPGGIAILLGGLLIPAAALRLRARTLGLLTAAGIAATVLAGYALFRAGIVTPVAPSLVALVTGAIGSAAVIAALQALARRDAEIVLRRFVPPAIAARLLRHGNGAELVPELRDATVMFCDVRDFSTWTEGRSAAEVLALLTAWLERVTETVMRHGGSVVSFQGDGVMCVFGAPTEHADAVAAALSAGREITGPLVRGLPGVAADGGPFRAGAGIHRGEVSSGTVGSSLRLEYAAIGDATVVAARLQSATKDHGVRLLISAAAVAERRDTSVALHPVGAVALRGRSEPLQALGLVDDDR